MKKVVLIAIAAAFVAALPTVATATVWDAYTDFSLTNNPNGAWSYGSTWDFTAEGWVFQPKTVPFYTIGWWDNIDPGSVVCVLTDTVIVCTAPDGDPYECPIVRWTAPADGMYSISFAFQQYSPDHWGDVTGAVLVNRSVVYSQYRPEDDMTIYSYDGVASLLAGDTIDFTMDSGPGDYYADWDRFWITVETVPEPSSIIALLAGLGGLAGMIRRRS